jgi:hypothetical protein
MSGSSRGYDFGALSRYADNRPTDLVDLASPFHSEASANVLYGASKLGRGHRRNIPVLINARAVLSARTAFPHQGTGLAIGRMAAIIRALLRQRRTLAAIACLFALALAGARIEAGGGPNLSYDHDDAPHGLREN